MKKEVKDEDENFIDDDIGSGDDIFKSEYGKAGADEDEKPSRKKSKMASSPVAGDDDEDMDDFIVDDDEDEKPKKKPAKSAKANGKYKGPVVTITKSKKRKSIEPDAEDDEEVEEPAPKKKAAAPKKPRAPRKEKTPEEETEEMKAIFDSVPTIKAPTPPPRDPDAKYDLLITYIVSIVLM